MTALHKSHDLRGSLRGMALRRRLVLASLGFFPYRPRAGGGGGRRMVPAVCYIDVGLIIRCGWPRARLGVGQRSEIRFSDVAAVVLLSGLSPYCRLGKGNVLTPYYIDRGCFVLSQRAVIRFYWHPLSKAQANLRAEARWFCW